ncbi:MAG: flippase [Chitinophagaceae bacterium]|nr:flippase [Chitinophagaceae bacterium]
MAVDAGLHQGSKKSLVKNVFSLGIVQVCNYVFPFITVPIVSRIIGPDKFGVLSFASSFVTYFTLLINFGFDLSATRAIAANRNNKEERNRIFNQVVLAKTLLFSISLILFLIALFTVPQLRDEKEVAIFSFLLCFAWVITPNWLYQGMQELSRVAIFNLVTKVIFTVIILAIIRERNDYIWQPLAISIAQILVGVYSFVYAIRRYDIRLALSRLQPVLQLLWSERIIFFSMVVINLYTTTNVVLLGFLQSETQVGYYSAGYRLILIIQSLISIPLSQAMFPFIGSAFGQSREKGLDMVRQMFPVVTILTFSAALVLWIFSPLVILTIYGHKFEPSIMVFRILAFVPVVVGWSNLFGIQTMINLKMDKVFFRITAVGAVTSILLNFLFVSKFGFVGTAISWVLTEIFIVTCMYVVLSRNGINIIEKKYFSPSQLKKYLRPIILSVKQKINR